MWWHNNVGNKSFFERVVCPVSVGGVVQYQPNNRTITEITACVRAGGVDVWLGLVDGQGTPDYHFGQVNHPVWVPLPPGVTSLTLVGVGMENPVEAHLIVGGF